MSQVLEDSAKMLANATRGAILLWAALAVTAGSSMHGQYPSQDNNESSSQAQGSNPIVGTWLQVFPAQGGGSFQNYMEFGADGSYRASSIQLGGAQNGIRSQFWGSYTIKPARDGRFLVTMNLRGKAPMQLCMAGYGCRSTGSVPNRPDVGYFTFNDDSFQSTNGFTAQRSSVPAVMRQQLPATWNLQPPPPLPSPQQSYAEGSRYHTPKNNIPGIGPNCDNAQQANVCHYGNGGNYHKDPNTGCMVCSQY